MKAENMVIGGRYNFKHQNDMLVYLGLNWSGNRYWHQFARVNKPSVVWSELQSSDLAMIVESK